MHLNRAFLNIRAFVSTLKPSLTRLFRKFTLNYKYPLRFLRTAPLMFLLASSVACAANSTEIEPELEEASKVDLVDLLHNASYEFVVVVYDKFKRLNEV